MYVCSQVATLGKLECVHHTKLGVSYKPTATRLFLDFCSLESFKVSETRVDKNNYQKEKTET